MTWFGVGNVEEILVRAGTTAAPKGLLRSSGQCFAVLASCSPSRAAGDLLIFATDGIRSEIDTGMNRGALPQKIADQILPYHSVSTDDALVLVAQFATTER